MTPTLTGSALDRISRCPPSALLPHAHKHTEPLRRGNVVHRFLQRVPAVGAERALAEAPADMQDALGVINLDALPLDPSAYAAEVAHAYDPATDTARELGRGLSREEAYRLLRPGEIGGTLDVLGLTADAAIVVDYKGPRAWLPPIRENMQLRLYALMAARTHNKRRGFIGTARIMDSGEPWWDEAELSWADLEDTAATVMDTVARVEALRGVPEAELVPEEGPWCTHCPALTSCRAKMGLIRSALEASGQGTSTPVLIPDNAALAYDYVRRLKRLVEQMEGALKLYAQRTPIELGDGWVYGPVEGEREYVADGMKALEALSHPMLRLDAERVRAAVKVDVSKAALERLVAGEVNDMKRAGQKLTKKDAFARLWDHLRAAGAIGVRRTDEIREHKVKQLPAGKDEAA